ncbi:twin-arginine translocase subunit TatC [Natronococcus wangiae]|uniref:twin-arginine translocase subunit TatC n=1 Tax=Natronococcus wangiae TaxID=3068275 RepID=UPI00273D90CD|nr:twin-arginine translocase subunit TatC [Natronococcus sp. AD5]
MDYGPKLRDTPFGRFLATVRERLRVLLVIFLASFLGVFYSVRLWLWPLLERDLLMRGAEIVALTPFDVILLQAKLATIGGIVFTLPMVIVTLRTSLGERGVWSWFRQRWYVTIGVSGLAVCLFVGGVAYAYAVIFPFLFEFLTANAIASGFTPTYSIVYWTQFILTLMLVMGAAAELPLVMTSLAYAEIVSYETFRGHWRVAIFGVVIASSVVNGSPDPFSMLLVAAPLVVLYGAGLLCIKLLVAVRAPKRISDASLSKDAESSVDVDETSESVDSDTDITSGSRQIADTIESTALGVSSAFVERNTDDEIEGYYDDIRCIISTLHEKLLIIGSVFMLVFFGVFVVLYQGGMGLLVNDFTSRLPERVRPVDVDIVLIHPVEILAFEMKVAAILALAAVVPLLCYYAWPAVLERGLATGSRVVFEWWALALVVGLFAGSVGGYLFVAPPMMAYLVTDATHAGMVVSYRAPSFFWLVFLASVGVGFLVDVVITMVVFHVTGIASYRTMRKRWREVTIALCCLGALLPQGVIAMLVIVVPVMVVYWLGLTILWLVSFGGRLEPVHAA